MNVVFLQKLIFVTSLIVAAAAFLITILTTIVPLSLVVSAIALGAAFATAFWMSRTP